MTARGILPENHIRYGLYLILLVLAGWVTDCQADSWVRVKWVADGDTIIVQDGRHVRYIGINTPEIDHERHRAAPMGVEARSRNRMLVEGWRLQLVYDQEKKDRYGRTLAYVYRRDGMFVNAELLKAGICPCLALFPQYREKENTAFRPA
jgi:micrococcal nuclease